MTVSLMMIVLPEEIMLRNWYCDMKPEKEIHIKITNKEYEIIKGKMQDAGVVNMSAFMRKMAIDGYMILLDLSDVNEVVRLLKINSNNLNQVAKKANESGIIYIQDIRQLQNQQSEIWEAVKEILVRLSNIN